MVQIVPGPEPVSPRSASRKREILEGASRVFRRQGLYGTGMRDIATELGMHVGNLYYYFENKEEILTFCQEEALSALLALAREVTASGAPPETQLRDLMIGHVLQLNRQVPGSLAHLEIEALTGPARRRVQRQRDTYERIYRELLVAGTRSGAFEIDQPKVAAMALLGALNWTVKWFRPEGDESAEEIAISIADLLLNGVTTRRTTGQQPHEEET